MSLSDLPALGDRPRMACPKGESRLQEAKAEKKLTLVDERTFRTEVWQRDAGCCRKCGRKVRKDLARSPLRGEVHHLHGRKGDLRFESKAAILVCCECHEQLTGRVNERWIAIGTKFWAWHSGKINPISLEPTVWDKLIDAVAPIKFERIV